MTDFEKFVIARWMYSIGYEYITNEEYNILYNNVKTLYPENEYVNRSWSSDPCPSELLMKYDLTDYIKEVIITDKTESIDSLGSLDEVKFVYQSLNEPCTGSYKHDGWNMQFSYYDGKLIWAQTRGRASDAKEANVLMSKVPQSIPEKGKVTIVTECTVSNSDFVWVRANLGNQYQRSAVSTLLANPQYSDRLSIHAFAIRSDKKYDNVFETLEEWGFQTPKWCRFDNFDSLMINLKRMSDDVSMYDYPTDGFVVSGTITKALRVFAWEEPVYRSFIMESEPYKESYGSHRISVACNIYPIRLTNSEQRVIPVTNYQRVIDNDLRPGYPIAFRLKSHAIADIDENVTRYLHSIYAGRYDEYRENIKTNEMLKQLYR